MNYLYYLTNLSATKVGGNVLPYTDSIFDMLKAGENKL